MREDPLLDLELIEPTTDGERWIMVASGGCTAAALAASGRVVHLHLVDPNPAQLALTRLKLHLLQTMPPTARLALLGHTPMPVTERAAAVNTVLTTLGLPADTLGPPSFVAEVGPDHAGRYEQLFVNCANRWDRTPPTSTPCCACAILSNRAAVSRRTRRWAARSTRLVTP